MDLYTHITRRNTRLSEDFEAPSATPQDAFYEPGGEEAVPAAAAPAAGGEAMWASHMGAAPMTAVATGSSPGSNQSGDPVPADPNYSGINDMQSNLWGDRHSVRSDRKGSY